MQPDTAVAVREEHPIVAAINDRMPAIEEMLPDGMDARRFRRVVIQALTRNRELLACTPLSVVTAITEAAEVGIEPTGVLGKGWLLPYNVRQPDGSYLKEAKFIPGWRGFVDLCWRADRLLLTPEVVRVGDAFEYRRGTGAFVHHVPVMDDPEREASDDNITFAYVVVRFPDGREDFEVMSRAAIDRISERAKHKNPVWSSDLGEMAKKTTIRRIAKRLPLSPAAQRILANDEDTDFDTPVERVADPRRDGLRDRIASRTAALRGEPIDSGESDAGVPTGGAEPEGTEGIAAVSSGGSPARKGDPWMARLHAVGNERGMDHDGIHDWAVQHFRVQSLTELDTLQRATLMEMVERMPIEQPEPVRAHAGSGVGPASVGRGGDGSSDLPAALDTPHAAGTAAATVSAELGTQPAPAPSMDDILAVTGGEEVQPKPGTPEYVALPAPAKASARAYWQRQAEPTLAEQLTVPVG